MRKRPDWLHEVVKPDDSPSPPPPGLPGFVPSENSGCWKWALFALWVIGTIVMLELRRRSYP